MAFVLKTRVGESSTSTGTGAFTLAGALTGHQAFSAVCSTADTTEYAIIAVDGSGNPTGAWETGLGTYSGANTLTRTTVSESSNSNAAVTFSAGAKVVLMTPLAARFIVSSIVGITGTIAQFNTAVSDADLAILGANTFTADQTLGENAAIVLDAALSADGKYTGIVQAGTAAAALAFGELCYKVTASSKWNKASGAAAGVNTVVAAGQLGICVLAAAGDAAATTMLMYGNVRADALFDTFTVGAALYMSAATAGKIVSAAPTGTTDFTVRKIGMSEDGNTVFFNPSSDYITLS